MLHGELIFSQECGRLDIKLDSDETATSGGLHCGECLDVLIDGKWKASRVEYSGGWFLVGLFPVGQIPSGLSVRY